jgi:hypothetical protein
MLMNLTHATARDIGSVLDRAGITWTYDDEGDIRVRFRSNQPPGTDAVFFEFDTTKTDFSMRGQFLNGRAVAQDNGEIRWEVPLDAGHEVTAIAQKVVTAYLMPRPGMVNVQIHAAIAPLGYAHPMHIKVIPGSQQVSKIEREFPGFLGAKSNTHFWMSTAVEGAHVEETQFLSFIRTISQVGHAMFEGPFTGWMYSTDV